MNIDNKHGSKVISPLFFIIDNLHSLITAIFVDRAKATTLGLRLLGDSCIADSNIDNKFVFLKHV